MIQLRNRLFDNMNLTGGIAALMQFDESVFDNFKVPDGVDKELVISTILMRDGDRPLCHPSPHWMKYNLGVWSAFMLPVWEKLLQTTKYEYNPIHNYDRTETRTVTRDRAETVDDERTTRLEGYAAANGLEMGDVSAENSDEYQPESRTSSEDITENTQDSEASGTTKTTGNETETESVRTSGNIGVTSSQELIQAEREVVRFSIYDVIENDFVAEFCLRVW